MWSHLKEKGVELPKITSGGINEKIKPVLSEMEEAGIRIDCDGLSLLEQKLNNRIDKLEKEILKKADCDFNINSPSQMAEVLFKKLKLPVDGLKRTKSGVSTAAQELRKLADQHEIISPILEHRELSKLVSTYLKPLPLLVDENSRLHTHYGLETTTGRLTSFEPNLQNIPIKGKYGMEIRRAFVAAPGMKLIAADYSQVELRVVATLAQDKSMLDAFTSGTDIHAKTASEIFHIPEVEVTHDQRRVAKAVNFGIVYGQTPFGLSQAIGISTEEAVKYIGDYFAVHTGIKEYINEMIAKAHKDGYVETLFGFKRYFPEINGRARYLAESEERMAINTPVQGSAAELLKLAMIKINSKLKTQNSKVETEKLARMILTVHDELVFEVPESRAEEIAKIVEDEMSSVIKLPIPIEVTVGVGDNWAECK
ncbi:MAG TPA: DNA polymerase [bacterium]|nr:DNA polymerase [bacterium]